MATTTKKKQTPTVVEGADSLIILTVNGNSAAHELVALQYLEGKYDLTLYSVEGLDPDYDSDSDNYVMKLERIG